MPRICAYLDAQQADVFVLTEWRDNDNASIIEAWANGNGLHCLGLSDGGTKSRNGVFVASKLPFTAHDVTPRRENPRVGIMMMVQASTWAILACYFPQRKLKPPFFAAVRNLVCVHPDEPLIVIGDLNNGHQARDRSEGGTPFIGSDDFDALSDKASLVDLWRLTHGNGAREFSYMSADGNGFRVDHAFGNDVFVRQFQPVSHYDHSTRITGVADERPLTDHSALIVALGE